MNADFGDINVIVNQAEAVRIWEKLDAQDAEIDTKVDKVDGMGLSSNDYTDEEKTKLANIQEGAEANVQPDWNETDTSADEYIDNKPDELTSADISEIVDSLS